MGYSSAEDGLVVQGQKQLDKLSRGCDRNAARCGAGDRGPGIPETSGTCVPHVLEERRLGFVVAFARVATRKCVNLCELCRKQEIILTRKVLLSCCCPLRCLQFCSAAAATAAAIIPIIRQCIEEKSDYSKAVEPSLRGTC